MKGVTVSKIKREENRSNRRNNSRSRNSSSVKSTSRATSIIHTSIKSSRVTPSSSHREEIDLQRFRQPTTVTVRSVSKAKSPSKPIDDETNQEPDSTHQFRKSTTSNPSVSPSCGTTNDLINLTHRYHPVNKKKKFIEYLCRCSRRRVLISLVSVMLISVIITIICVLLLQKSPKTGNNQTRVAILRWNTSGITLFGTSGIRGNASNQFNNPFGLILTSNNDFYIADRRNNRIQKCRLGSSTCTTAAGQANSIAGTNSTHLNGSTYVYMDSNNGLYIADSNNHRVQYWSEGASFGTTIAGITYLSGSALTQLNIPYGITLNSNLIYVADCNNDRVLRLTSGNLSGTVVAGGNGRGFGNTQLNCPAGLYFDSFTNSLTIANFMANNIIQWKLGDSQWTIVAGNSNGINGNTSAFLDHPTSFIYDPMGNIYVADMFNHRVQMFPIGQSNGTTIAGISGILGNSSTMLYYPVALALDNQLNLYVTDSFNQRIQQFLRY